MNLPEEYKKTARNLEIFRAWRKHRRYGLGMELSRAYGISPQRVRQIIEHCYRRQRLLREVKEQ